ncbi:hypothetical protein AX774_g3113 [Zancudomyces culisetae]|uniref:Uncharacterized protein n=1 Tax=Zancudomyces culisetae TaxID=1213189 RepID=A0A1R1PR09_ZANCU|nr:hypothetical protein AX774_g3113 [Zancudomyces culisetae]|eukprot:OMH83388.1 hypothetical protein AX774_g3113 [Zancudomyces culisetae]
MSFFQDRYHACWSKLQVGGVEFKDLVKVCRTKSGNTGQSIETHRENEYAEEQRKKVIKRAMELGLVPISDENELFGGREQGDENGAGIKKESNGSVVSIADGLEESGRSKYIKQSERRKKQGKGDLSDSKLIESVKEDLTLIKGYVKDAVDMGTRQENEVVMGYVVGLMLARNVASVNAMVTKMLVSKSYKVFEEKEYWEVQGSTRTSVLLFMISGKGRN